MPKQNESSLQQSNRASGQEWRYGEISLVIVLHATKHYLWLTRISRSEGLEMADQFCAIEAKAKRGLAFNELVNACRYSMWLLYGT